MVNDEWKEVLGVGGGTQETDDLYTHWNDFALRL